MPNCASGFLLVCIGLGLASANAADLKAVENQAKAEFYGKDFLMSHAYLSSKLRFNSSGALVGQSEEGTWTMNGVVHVTDVEVKPNLIRVQASREILILRTIDGVFGMQLILLPKSVDAAIEVSGNIETLDDVKRTVALVFHQENLRQKLNGYWHEVAKVTGVDPKSGHMDIQGAQGGVFGYLEGERPVYFHSSQVQPPKAVHKGELEYSRTAAAKRTQGKTFMLVVVDERGYPAILHLVKDLGDDLDVQSMAGASQWRFRPATKDGQAVACVINLMARFTSY